MEGNKWKGVARPQTPCSDIRGAPAGPALCLPDRPRRDSAQARRAGIRHEGESLPGDTRERHRIGGAVDLATA